MKQSHSADHDLSVGEQATQWLCTLEGEGDQRQAAFFAWLRASPRHVEEFLFATTVWKKLHQFGQNEPARIDRLIAEIQAMERESSNVIALDEPLGAARPAQISDRELPTEHVSERLHERPRRRWLAAASIVALVGAGALALWTVSVFTAPPVYFTGVGEQRILRLDDGSTMQLNTKSRAVVRYSETGRDVELLDGEALFTVKRDRARPFRVSAGSSVVQAVGTQFNVYRRSHGTRVSVIEGKVQVFTNATGSSVDLPSAIASSELQTSTLYEEEMLGAGEELNVSANGAIVKEATPDVAKAVAWREQLLVFRADRLEDVAAEVNRYSSKPILVHGDAARNLQLTAVFDSSDPESLVRFLEKVENLGVEDLGDSIVIRERGSSAQ